MMSLYIKGQPPPASAFNSEIRFTPQITTLTFGIELEFTLATTIPNTPDPAPDDPRPADINPHPKDSRYSKESIILIQNHIVSALQDVSIPAYSNHEIKYTSVDDSPTSTECDDEAWVVKDDYSIRAPDTKYGYYGIELSSPIYYFKDGSISEIGRLCNILQSRFRVETNRSCGLHVHVGNGDHGFDFPTLRNLAAFLWCFEAQLAQIHPKHRRDSDWAISFAGGFEHCRLGQLMRVNGITSKRPDLMAHTNADRGAYHFGLQSRPFPYGEKKTIEFRIHEGCLDAERVANWVRVCHALVKYAKDGAADVEQFCRRNVDRQIEGVGHLGCSLWKVLMRIGCVEEAWFYCGRKRRGEVEPLDGVGPEKLVIIGMRWRR